MMLINSTPQSISDTLQPAAVALQASITTPRIDTRTQRAAGIVQAGDIQLSQPGLWRVRDRTGSGTWHHVTATTCDCRDFGRTGLPCKHLIAKDEYQKQTKERARATGPTCPDCGSATAPESAYFGSRGFITWQVCQVNKEHKATRIS